jgi:SAM-dependent methyltransferase/tetratricopeptide (TPR) repeat protein
MSPRKAPRNGKPPGTSDKGPERLAPREIELALRTAAKARHEGRLAEAKRVCEAVLAEAPDNFTALHLYGVLAFQAGQTDAAIAIMGRAISRAPGEVVLYNDLGKMLASSGEVPEAMATYRRALALDPNQLAIRHELALLYTAAGEADEAIEHFCKAFELAPGNELLRQNFAVCMRGVSPNSLPVNFEAAVHDCFAHDDVEHQNLAHAAIAILKRRAVFPALRNAAASADAAWLGSATGRRSLEAFVDDPLLHALLGKALVVDAELEAVLAWLRRLILMGPLADFPKTGAGHRFLASLGLQCFHSAFVYVSSPAEGAAVEALASTLAGRIAADTPPTSCERELLRLALYRPIHGLPFADRIAEVPADAWSESAAALLARTLFEPREEAGLAAEIRSLVGTGDATSRAVQAQYEEDPFPPWLTIGAAARTSLGAYLRETLPGFDPPKALDRPVDVLIAGSGTGKHPLEISRLREAREIVAIDLSRASLAYALRMARKLGIDGVRFIQGDILDAGKLDRGFDLVECVGVLHHMASPLAGWRALLELLRPDGVMRIGLYSERARSAVVNARRRIQELGLLATPDDIRALRARIVADEEPGLEGTRMFADFFNLSACRDLMFHACEHRFTPLGIAEALAGLGLEFLGFELSPSLARTYRERFPDDPKMMDLARWEGLEAELPNSFFRMFVFWCRRVPS